MKYGLTTLLKPATSMREQDWLDRRMKVKGAKIITRKDDGVHRLAYPFNGYDEALYLYYTLDIEDEEARLRLWNFLEKVRRDDGCVLRSLLVVADTRRKNEK